jgi:arylformamidase
MNDMLYQAHKALGAKMTPAMVQASCDLAIERQQPGLGQAVTILRDQAYGPDARHRLDLFVRSDAAADPRPVLLFVHGGGFVSGDRQMVPGSPFYDNVGQWAADNDMVGATMTYRLAPGATWPAGAHDIRDAVSWLHAHIAAHGGDPARVFVIGQSAGATHVADYLAHPDTAAHAEAHVAGAIMFSCLYDVGTAEHNKLQMAYFGADTTLWPQRSALPGLLATRVPLLCAAPEFDMDDFHHQALTFATAWGQAKGSYPPMLRLSGHNHISTVLQLGSVEDTVGPEIVLFVATAQPIAPATPPA